MTKPAKSRKITRQSLLELLSNTKGAREPTGLPILSAWDHPRKKATLDEIGYLPGYHYAPTGPVRKGKDKKARKETRHLVTTYYWHKDNFWASAYIDRETGEFTHLSREPNIGSNHLTKQQYEDLMQRHEKHYNLSPQRKYADGKS